MDMPTLLRLLSEAEEYSELPVRHNEDKLNAELARDVPWPVDARNIDDPHVKANLLFQAHFSRCRLPISDYITDTDQAPVPPLLGPPSGTSTDAEIRVKKMCN